ncbi:NAD(P)-dependent oxidoreductase [Saccharopolyspora sp. NFXS83]|uniref:NAD-dependent epimerase/dehydratase family protein n=1 Tax=Saccharopolyspora sp. NFXS83 TaxID=2993560 RepID=UPI00224AD2C6|nr:NAD(P)-dependent oxidoreductase [Saccharopolyspora sp. NFXS83]MCX2729158.1 NAD(P)-dependent oxidoreductase [Saccharopolyspora sp. NFXS83]
MRTGYWHGRTVIVTGGRGFIGTHFTRELAAAGARVLSLHRDRDTGPATTINDSGVREIQTDLLSSIEVQSLFRYAAAEADALIHCAGLDGNSEFKEKNFGSILDSNIRITSNVLNAARDYRIPTVVLLSSAEIYTGDRPDSVREEDDYRARMALDGDGYTLSKIFAELLADAYRKQFGMRILLARPSNVYGPGDGTNPRAQRVIPAMMRRIASGEPITIWGDGQQRRSFVHVRDLVQAVLGMTAAGAHDTFNVAGGGSVTLLELARMLFKEFGVDERIELDRSKPTGARGHQLNTDRLVAAVDFTPRPLAEGLAETVHWYRSALAGRTD